MDKSHKTYRDVWNCKFCNKIMEVYTSIVLNRASKTNLRFSVNQIREEAKLMQKRAEKYRYTLSQSDAILFARRGALRQIKKETDWDPDSNFDNYVANLNVGFNEFRKKIKIGDGTLSFHIKELKRTKFLTNERGKYQVGIEYLSLTHDTIRFLEYIESIEPHRIFWHKGIGYFGLGFPQEESTGKLLEIVNNINSIMKPFWDTVSKYVDSQWESQMMKPDKFFPKIIVIDIITLLESKPEKRDKS